jgi:voltage-gated potassium channel
VSNNRIFHWGIVRTVIKDSGFGHACLVFLIAFIVCALLVWLLDPNVTSINDALWFCFQVVTTIGFGDITIASIPARIVSVVLSIVSIFFLAVITAAVVNFTTESMKARRNKSLALFLDKLEHLDTLSKDELADLSQKVRKLDTRNLNE